MSSSEPSCSADIVSTGRLESGAHDNALLVRKFKRLHLLSQADIQATKLTELG